MNMIVSKTPVGVRTASPLAALSREEIIEKVAAAVAQHGVKNLGGITLMWREGIFS